MGQEWALYKRQPAFVFGFHGCDREVGEAVLRGETQLEQSQNDYDWLGNGIYFWEANPARAFQFAQDAAERNKKSTRGSIRAPFVVGAVVDLGCCFNLVDSASLAELKRSYEFLAGALRSAATEPPVNKGGPDKLMRKLDCAVIESMHWLRQENRRLPYDTVRSAFGEGDGLYPGAGFTAKAHIQIAVRNVKCIRAYFRPIPD